MGRQDGERREGKDQTGGKKNNSTKINCTKRLKFSFVSCLLRISNRFKQSREEEKAVEEGFNNYWTR